jgi:HAD superfamily hydrolase (TIGR01509 family)
VTGAAPVARDPGAPPAAVVFDLDGVLVDSETVWDDARRQVVARYGGSWCPDATRAMMGMSSPEWATYLHDTLGVALPASDIIGEVVELVERRYRDGLPLLPGATESVRALAGCWPLALASSSNRPIIDLFLDASGLKPFFTASVSSEEAPHGKPAPDVYLEATRRLAVRPERCVAVEDSTNGIRAAVAAGIAVIAVPNTHFPPDDAALRMAAVVVGGVGEITVELVRAAGGGRTSS